MAFNNLNKEELAKVAEFFVKDVEVSDEAKGASKKELLAALASDQEAAGPVTWEDYNEYYLPSLEQAAPAPVEPEAPKLKSSVVPSPDDDDDDEAESALVLYTGRNPRWDVIGYTFVKTHPFHKLPVKKAEWLIKNQSDRFRLALPSEVSEYYN